MKVIMELVESCSDCRFNKIDGYLYEICTNPIYGYAKRIDEYPIPDWCPLPNREDAKEMIA